MQYFWFGLDGLPAQAAQWGQLLLTAYPANQLLLDLLKNSALSEPCQFVLPISCKTPDFEKKKEILFCPIQNARSEIRNKNRDFCVFSNGAVLTAVDKKYLRQLLASFSWEAAAFQVDPALDACCEQVKRTSNFRIVGFRRQYQPGVEPGFPSHLWPDLLFCKPAVFEHLLCSFLEDPLTSFSEHCARLGQTIHWLRIGGRRMEVFSPAGLAELLRCSQSSRICYGSPSLQGSVAVKGNVHVGRSVVLEAGCVVAPPAILCDRARVEAGAILQGSLLGPGVSVPAGQSIQRQAIWGTGEDGQQLFLSLNDDTPLFSNHEAPFRCWPFFSYARLGKRLVDLLISILVLLLFLPFFPVIALVIKLTSPGPVFYRARRQGRHGRPFHCLKFRTMNVGADSLQESLRIASQVDGPQFKIDDDPRTSPVGKFLRDTCIDELPQFLNVLAGQMGVVGPRPSPESENEYCPAWRDARLSVRPGITGLWQICRTRQASRDFQEWIFYDMEYVRRLSLGLDLSICLKTARKLIVSFLDQFG